MARKIGPWPVVNTEDWVELVPMEEGTNEPTPPTMEDEPTILYFLQTNVRGPWENMTPFSTYEEASEYYHGLMKKAHRHGRYRVVRYEQTAVILGNG